MPNPPRRLYDAYIFDLDGTVYLGNALLPGALDTILHLRARDRRTVFLSNNPTQSREAYAQKLTDLGLPTDAADVVNSSSVMRQFLSRTMPGARLFVIGEQPLVCELSAGGFPLTDNPDEIEAVIASFDRTFEYRKLQIAFDAIRAGARFFATNADRYCPVPGGGQPDAAAVIAAIEACTSTQVEAVVGKPSRHMLEAVLDRLDVPVENCLIIGDRLETDVQMGINAGMHSALTLTGVTQLSEVKRSKIRPTYVVNDLRELIDR